MSCRSLVVRLAGCGARLARSAAAGEALLRSLAVTSSWSSVHAVVVVVVCVGVTRASLVTALTPAAV